jgi:hypothetical protein
MMLLLQPHPLQWQHPPMLLIKQLEPQQYHPQNQIRRRRR